MSVPTNKLHIDGLHFEGNLTTIAILLFLGMALPWFIVTPCIILCFAAKYYNGYDTMFSQSIISKDNVQDYKKLLYHLWRAILSKVGLNNKAKNEDNTE